MKKSGEGHLSSSNEGSTNSPGANLVARSAPAEPKPGMVSDNLSPFSTKQRELVPPVGCELEFKPLLAADTNHGSAFPNDTRPDERSFGQ